MSITTISDLRARSERSPADHCWHWQGAKSVDGSPRIHTLDYDRGEKLSLSGPKAVYFIAFERPLNGRLAYRTCFSTDCVNPSHILTAASRAEIGLKLAKSGVRKGTHIEARRASLDKARIAAECVPTPRAVVLAIREAPKSMTATALAQQHGLAVQTVSRIRRNESRKEICA